MPDSFDPDAFLREEPKAAPFDPDAFLSEKPESGFDPDEFLGTKETPAPRRRSYARELADTLQKSNLFTSATGAAEGAWDKTISRKPNGEWDLPLMTPLKPTDGVLDSAVNTIGGMATALGQKLGARMDLAGPAVDTAAVQNTFNEFQKANGLSDDEVKTAWQDFGNINRTWEEDEKVRVLSDGTVFPNPGSSVWLDKDQAEKAIASAPTSEEAKQAMRDKLPDIRNAIASNKLEAYETASDVVNKAVAAQSIGNPRMSRLVAGRFTPPTEWAKQQGRTDLGTPEFVRDYEKSVVDAAPWVRQKLWGLSGKLVTGWGQVANTVLGLGGLAGSDTMSKMAGEGSQAQQTINQGLPNTGVLGSVVEQTPSLIAQMGPARLLGLLGSKTLTTLGTYGMAGAQSAGMTYADLISQGVDEKTAREKAVRTGVSTAVITSLFGTGSAGGVESAIAGKEIGEVTMRELADIARQQGVKNFATSPQFREFVGTVLKEAGGEAAEEGIDQFAQAFLLADPDTSVADAWTQAKEAAFVGGAMGSGVQLAMKAMPYAPESARAAMEPVTPESAATAPLTNEAPTENPPLELPVPTVPIDQSGTEGASAAPVSEIGLPPVDGTTGPETPAPLTDETKIPDSPVGVAPTTPIAETPQEDLPPGVPETGVQPPPSGPAVAGSEILGTPRPGFTDQFVTPEGATIELLPDGKASFIVPPDQRGQGAGNAAVERVKQYADTTGTTIKLDIEPLGNEPGMSRAELADWYERRGFTVSEDRLSAEYEPSPAPTETVVGEMNDFQKAAQAVADKEYDPRSPEFFIYDDTFQVDPSRLPDGAKYFPEEGEAQYYVPQRDGSWNLVWKDLEGSTRVSKNTPPPTQPPNEPNTQRPEVAPPQAAQPAPVEAGAEKIYHGTGSEPGLGQRSGYYPGTYTSTSEGKASEFGGNIFSTSVDPAKIFNLSDAEALKTEARDAGFEVRNASGNGEVEFLKSRGYYGMRRGSEVILFDNFDLQQLTSQTQALVEARAPGGDATGDGGTAATPQAYSVDALKAAFDLTDEQAVVADAIGKALGARIDLVAKGGVPGSGALSQESSRFNELTKSIPANPTQADLDAWKAANPEAYAELRAMRERVLREAGYDTDRVLWRGDALPLTQFRGAVYLSDSQSLAEDFRRQQSRRFKASGREDTSVVRPFFIKKGLRMATENTLINGKKLGSVSYLHSPFTRLEEIGDKTTAEQVRAEGYDGVEGDMLGGDYGDTEIAVFNPSDIKSTEPLNLDESGKLIPPSQWGDTGSPSILYQNGPARAEFDAMPDANKKNLAFNIIEYGWKPEDFGLTQDEVNTWAAERLAKQAERRAEESAAEARSQAVLEKSKTAPSEAEIVTDEMLRESQLEDDGYFYHVTTPAGAKAILKSRKVMPGRRQSMSDGYYADYSKGKVFFTDRGGVGFWQDRISDHLEAQGRNGKTVTIRIPKHAVGDLQIDTLGTKDARSPAWFSDNGVLFQGPKASFEITETGKILLRGLQNPDFTSAVHEIAHAARRSMGEVLDPKEVRIVEQWAGVKQGKWGRYSEEKWARAWERYFREGKAPLARLQGIFDKIAGWMTEVYRNITGSEIDVEITPEVRAIMDKLAGRMVVPEETKPRLSATKFSDVLAGDQKGRRIKATMRDEAGNYETPEGVEVTITDEANIAEFNGKQYSGDIEIDFIGVPKAENRGTGAASKEMDRILAEADSRDMSVGLVVDPENATDKGAPKGLSAGALIKWYERKGFIFDGRVGYRPRKSENREDILPKKTTVTKDQIPEIEAALNEGTEREFSDPESMFNSFAQNPASLPTGYLTASDEVLYYYDGVNRPLPVEGISVDFNYKEWRYELTPTEDTESDALTPPPPELPNFEDALEDDSVTGLYHAQTDADRARLGLPPRFKQPRTTDQDAWDRATAAEDAHRAAGKPGTAGTDLLTNLLNDVPRVLTKNEHALLLHEKLVREQAVEAAQAKLNSLPAGTPDGVRKDAQAAVKSAQDAFDLLVTYADAAGSAAGLSLQARKMLVNMDFSLAAVVNRLKAAANMKSDAPVKWSEKDQKAAVEIAEKLQQAQERVDALEAENSEQVALIEQLTQDVERAQTKLENRMRTSRARSLVKEKLNPLVEAAKARMAERRKAPPTDENAPLYGLIGPTPEMVEDLKDIAIISAGWVADKALTLQEFSSRLVAEFGDWVAEHAQSIFRQARSLYIETAESVSGGNAPTPESVVKDIDPAEPLDKTDVWALARAHVVAGKRGRNVLDAVFGDLSSVFPNLTRDEVAEAFTGYGTVVYPSTKAVPAELRRIRSLEREYLKQADIRAGQMPKRTGYQGDAKKGPEWAEVRAEQQRTADALRELENQLREAGLPVPSDERKLANALNTKKRRLTNEIEEIELALKSKTPRTPKSRTPIADDAEVRDLEKRLAEKRAEYEEVFKDESAREKRILGSLKKRRMELERRINEKDFSRPEVKPPVNTEAKRKAEYEFAKVRAKFEEMRHKYILENAPLPKKVGHYVMSGGNLLKILTLGGDIGVVMRQLGTTYQALSRDLGMLAPTKEGAKRREDGSYLKRIISEGVKSFGSSEYEHTAYERLMERQNAGWDKTAGLVLSAPFDIQRNSKEDIPAANLLDKIPWWMWPALAGLKVSLLGTSFPVSASILALGAVTKPFMQALDRAQRTMTNQSRAMFFDAALAALHDGNPTVQEAKAIAKAVMVGTGRGTATQKIESAIPFANQVILATRYYISRIQALTLYPLLNKDARASRDAQREISRMYARSVAGRAVLYGLAAMAFGKALTGDDDDPEEGLIIDPRNPNFGRVKLANGVSLDFMSGLNNFASAAARYFGKVKVDPTTGKKEVLGPGFTNNVNDEALRFLRSKLNIQFSFLVNTHAGEYFGGKPVNLPNALEEITTAIIVNDTFNTYKAMMEEYGPTVGAARASLFLGLMFGGAGTSVLDSEAEKEANRIAKKEADMNRRMIEAEINE
mgnify:FL=1